MGVYMETVRVFLMNTDAARWKEDSLFSVLPRGRVEKAARHVRESDRLLSLCAGYLIFRAVGDHYVDKFGKPRADGCFFSVSHSGKLAVLALCESRDVGIDIEAVRAEKDEASLAEHCFDAREMKEYAGGAPFLALFTSKESLSKAEGCGLGNDPKAIPALPLDGKTEYKGKIYFRHTLALDGYYASVALEGEDFITTTEEVYVT